MGLGRARWDGAGTRFVNIARPTDGFRIALSPPVRALVENEKTTRPGFEAFWDDIIERLKFTAHREGVSDRRLGPGHRVWTTHDGVRAGQPRVRLVYHVLGDTVTIRMAQFG